MSDEIMITLEDAIALIVSQATSHGIRITRTKLVKLLYFLDLQAMEELGRTVTGVEWIWHNFGPYAESIPIAWKAMVANGELAVEEAETIFGGQEYRYRTRREGYYRAPSDTIIPLVRRIVKRYGRSTATQIKDLSYKTAPMLRVLETGRQGDVLEFDAPIPRKEDVERAIDYYRHLAPRPEDDDQGNEYGDIASGLRSEIEGLAPARARAMDRMFGDE